MKSTESAPEPFFVAPLIPRNLESARAEQRQMFDRLLQWAERWARTTSSMGDLERVVGSAISSFGQQMMALMFALACQQAMFDDLRRRGLSLRDVRIRSGRDGYISVHTTFGPVTFPTFAYRDMTSFMGTVVRHPEYKLFPYHRKCRSSPLCLEWEARLGAQHPFRKAEELFHFFTRGASTVEDTTISRHILSISSLVDANWLYRTPEEIREILTTRATRHKETGLPLIYLSTDAHALRRYIDATWTTNWKMINGVRLWCEDATTGELIHLGGEFTWGDCRVVGARIKELVHAGIVPSEGHEVWQGVDPHLVFVSDGAEWIVDHVLYPSLGSATVILDPYHALEWLAEFAGCLYGKGKPLARALNRKVREILLGKAKTSDAKQSKPRKGHRKKRGGHNRHAYDHHPSIAEQDKDERLHLAQPQATTAAVLELLSEVQTHNEEQHDALEALVGKLARNTLRMDYELYMRQGMQIGSGAMESMHRTGSQRRTKLPGAWLKETSLSVLKFRMLELSGRWEQFWRRTNISELLAGAFNSNQEMATPCAA